MFKHAICLLLVPLLWTPLKPVASESLLDNNSYEVHTVVRHFETDEGKLSDGDRDRDADGGRSMSRARLDIRVEEKYSHQQARGLVSFRLEGLPDWVKNSETYNKTIGTNCEAATFYSSPRDKITLVMKDGTGRCRPTDHDELLKVLELDFMPVELARGLDHVIGPARWVHYMANHRQKLRLDMKSSHVTVREVPSIRYTMEMTDKNGNTVDVRVFYEEMSLCNSQQHDALPHRVAFIYGSRTTFIDVHQIKFGLSTGDILGHRSLISDEPDIDTFTLMPVSGCLHLLNSAESRKTLSELRGATTHAKSHFSFRAHVKQVPRLKDLDLVVAYDDTTRMMRVDMDAPDYSIAKSIVLFNYFRNYVYHVLKSPSRDTDLMVQHVLNLDSSDQENGATHDESLNRFEKIRQTEARCTGSLLSYVNTMDTFTPSRLIFGANEFVYLGLARVRGIRSKVYEAIDAELPHWLEPPVDYSDAKNNIITRLASNKNSPIGRQLDTESKSITLIYMTDENVDSESGRVLLVEIYRTDASYKLVHDKRVIQFHDFAWSSNSFGVHGRSSDLFSMADYCSDSTTRSARVELLLEQMMRSNQNEPISARAREMLALSRPRSRATLTSLQRDLNVFVEMVYDLQTRPIEVPPDQIKQHPWRTFVNFNLAKGPSNQISAMFVGRGRKASGRSWFFNLPGFFHCFMLAAHLKVEILFAWDPKMNSCFLSTISASQETKDGSPSFELLPNGQLEIYRANDYKDHLESSNYDYKREQLRGTTLSLRLGIVDAAGQEEPPIRMQIKQLKTSGFEQKAKVGGLVEVIRGWGLTRQAELNIKSAEAEVSGFSECHSICFNDLTCRAFSFCVHGGAVAECLISRIAFDSPLISKHLSDSKSKLVELEIGGNKITLRRSLTCSIHNHRYINHFVSKPEVVQQLHEQRVLPVETIEDCARLCVSASFKCAASHQDHLAEALDQMKPSRSSSRTELSEARLESLEKLARSSRFILSSICTAFHFLDKRLVDSLTENDRVALVKLAGKSEGGYCDLHAIPNELSQGNRHFFSPPISLQSYAIQYIDLYEEQYGVSLLASKLSEEETRVFRLATLSMKRWLPNKMVDNTDLLLGLIERGENMQETDNGHPMYVDRERCAEMCFKQTSGFWPACKSFDIITVEEFGSLRVNCVFNTITRQEAIANGRSDLIDTNARDYERWHYEPKVKIRDTPEQVEELRGLLISLSQLLDGSSLSGHSFWSHLSLIIIATLGIVSGFLVSVFASPYLQKRCHGQERNHSQGSQAPVLSNDLELNRRFK